MPPRSIASTPTPKSGHLSQFRVLLGDRILQANARMAGRHGGRHASRRSNLRRVASEAGPRRGRRNFATYSRVDNCGKRVWCGCPIRFLKMNETCVWAAPVELFSEIAIDIRNRSPFTQTFYFGYTNGWFGYLPTAAAFAEGGYEPATSVFTKAPKPI